MKFSAELIDDVRVLWYVRMYLHFDWKFKKEGGLCINDGKPGCHVGSKFEMKIYLLLLAVVCLLMNMLEYECYVNAVYTFDDVSFACWTVACVYECLLSCRLYLLLFRNLMFVSAWLFLHCRIEENHFHNGLTNSAELLQATPQDCHLLSSFTTRDT